MQRDQSGEDSKQRGLPRAVPTRQEDDLALVDVQVDTGERREPAEKAHGRSETDDGLHSASGKQVPRVYGRPAAAVEPRPEGVVVIRATAS
jgi:hypothetical protein